MTDQGFDVVEYFRGQAVHVHAKNVSAEVAQQIKAQAQISCSSSRLIPIKIKPHTTR